MGILGGHMYIEIYSIVGKRCRKNKQGRNRLKLLANGRLEMKSANMSTLMG